MERRFQERVILESLGRILTRLISYEPDEVRDRAITLVRGFAEKKDIDYEAEVKKINHGRDKQEGIENKENALKALQVLRKILHPNVPIDVKTLTENLKKAPNVSKAMDAKWLIKNASSPDPHYLAYLFHKKLPEEGELERIRERWKKEGDKNERRRLAWAHDDLLRAVQYQSYWENVFKVLNLHGIDIGKKKLQESKSILAEAEVFSRLAPHFEIEPEPDIEALRPKKLEALITYNGEKALIEVASVHQRLEVELAEGGISFAGGKVKSVLLNKFKGQLKGGKDDPGIPILIILHLENFVGSHEVRDGVYGQLQVTWATHRETGKVAEDGTTRAENAFYDIDGSEIVTTIGAYERDYGKKDPLVGKLHHPFKTPKNKISQKFRLLFRDALFGESETSNWKSLMCICGVDEKMARLLYSNGIEDLQVLGGIQEGDFVVDGISWEKLLQLKKEAIRVIGALSKGQIRFLKGIDQESFDVLQKEGIYLIKDMLKREEPPDSISVEAWTLMIEDGRRILQQG